MSYTLPFSQPQRVTGPGSRVSSDITFSDNYKQQVFYSNGGLTRYAVLVNGPAAGPSENFCNGAWNPAGGTPTTKCYVHVMKSADGGSTWAEVGTPNTKELSPKNENDTSATQGFRSVSVVQDGSILIIARPVWDFATYATAAPHPIVVSQFNMDTDDWGADLSVSGDADAPQAYITYGYYPAYTPFYITKRESDGAIFLEWREKDLVTLSPSGTDLVVVASGTTENGTDLYITGGGLIGSLSYLFIGGDVGKFIQITSTTGGFAPGTYRVTAVDGSGHAIPDRPAGIITASGGTWLLAGANTVSSATYPFAEEDIGQVIQITAGVNFNTGFFGIADVNIGIATVYHAAPPIDLDPGTLGATGGTWVLSKDSRPYERTMLSKLVAGAWESAVMIFGTVGEALDYEPVGIVIGDDNRLHCFSQKVTSVNYNSTKIVTIQARTLTSGDAYQAIGDVAGGVLLPSIAAYRPTVRIKQDATRELLLSFLLGSLPCQLKIARAASADNPVWTTEAIADGNTSGPHNSDTFNPEFDAYPVACDLTTSDLYLAISAPLGNGAPWFVPYLLNLFSDIPTWDAGVTIWDETDPSTPGPGGDSNPLIGPVTCANEYSGFFGMLLDDGPAGEYLWDDVWYFELGFTVPDEATVNCSITIAGTALALICNSPPSGFVGVEYEHQIGISGGVPPYTVTISVGTLPIGLSINNVGLITGTPTLAGLFLFTVHVVDDVGSIGNIECSILIIDVPGTDCPEEDQGGPG